MKNIYIVSDGPVHAVTPAVWSLILHAAREGLLEGERKDYYRGVATADEIAAALATVDALRRPGPLPGKQPGA